MGDGWWVADAWALGPIFLVSWVFWVVFSIVLHELGHGWAALRCGDGTPVETGHMTWNPLVHMGGVSLILFALVGICWGAMPVNPARFRGRFDDAIVSAAGPAMNLGLFAVTSVAAAAWIVFGVHGPTPDFNLNVEHFLTIGSMLNLALMLFNLLPVPPLDGSRILSTFFPGLRRPFTTERGAVIALIGFVLVFRFVGTWVFDAAFQGSHFAIALAARLFGADLSGA